MYLLKTIVTAVSMALLSGCASTEPARGPQGPTIISSGYVTEAGQYAEIGVQFSSPGDFVALFSPRRWRSPIAPGGALSWVNPYAWQEDGTRTRRVFLGQAILVGGLVVASADGGGSNGSSNGGGGSKPLTPDGDPPSGPGNGSITIPTSGGPPRR